MKIVFMGTPQAAVPCLKRLIDDGHDVVAVYTQPDRPSGRGNKITFSPVKEFALANGIEVLQPTKIKTAEAVEKFRAFNADVAVVVAYGRILPESYLTAFPRGAINVHFSILPKYRGAAPVNWAIVNGEKTTGVTTMNMDVGLDTGDILLQYETAIGDEEDSIELMSRLADAGADLLSKTLAEIETITPQNQDDTLATFAPIMAKSDGLINWEVTADEIANRIRGFQPFPTTYTLIDGKKLTLWQGASVEHQSENNEPGTIIQADKQSLVICCGGKTALRIDELQPEGKRRMNYRDFLNGANFEQGSKFSD